MMDRDDEQEPLFDSLEEACEAFGFDAATKERIHRDMLMTQPRDVSTGSLH